MRAVLAIIKKYKIATVAIIVLILLIIVSKFLNKKDIEQPDIPNDSQTIFQLIHHHPPNGKLEIFDTNLAIQYTFSEAVDLNSVQIEISPTIKHETSTNTNQNTLYIHPISSWEYDTKYNISINLNSIKGDTLTTPVSHSFEFTQMTNSLLTE